MKPARFPSDLLSWLEARKRHRLTDAHVQMARELGLNPGKLGGLDNHRQELWKAPLPQFIEQCYLKRFGIDQPAEILSLEDWVARKQARRERKKADRRQRLAEPGGRRHHRARSDCVPVTPGPPQCFLRAHVTAAPGGKDHSVADVCSSPRPSKSPG
jgi:hypothetical protein